LNATVSESRKIFQKKGGGEMDPRTFKGMIGFGIFGFTIGMIALLTASLAPNLIPAKAQGVNL
jgi:hypothetical protein